MVSTDKVIGKWKNSKIGTKGIGEFELSEYDGNFSLTVRGADGGYFPSEISILACTAHSSSPSSNTFSAFQAEAKVDGSTYFFAGNINKGLIIIATYIQVESDDKSNFFIREFFYKLK